MKVGLVAIHYPRPEQLDNLLARVRQAVEVIRSTSGCLCADCWLSTTGDVVVSTGEWVSGDALTASFAYAKAAGVDFEYDERESRPRVILRLISQ